MSQTTGSHVRKVDLAAGAVPRTMQTLGRGLLRRCPYCGGPKIFKNWFELKERCPSCNTLFAHEDGYFLGSYIINLGLTAVIAVLIAFWLIFQTDLSVVQMQIGTVILVVGLPLFLYPYSLSLWMTLDLLLHPHFEDRVRR
jgi:uncharacterized protein (DUF983 family)